MLVEFACTLMVNARTRGSVREAGAFLVFFPSDNPAVFLTRRDTMYKQLTAIIDREGDGYVSLCPELDIASQGESITEACDNL